ncbi:hypothetical protein ABTJ92_19625, partial [Acinetobacter baumannii]
AIIVVDPSDIVVFLNKAAEIICGKSRPRIPVALESFLRASDVEFEDLLAASRRGKAQGSVRIKSTGRILLASRRMLPVADRPRGFEIYFLR